MDSAELARWTRFAAKGGIGKCTALSDCVAENEGDLMFLKDDEVVVLMQLNEQEGKYLGYCEGVVGRFSGSDVRFHGKLKKPVMTKRSSTGAKSSSPRQSSAAQSPVRASTDDEKPITTSASPFSIDSMISPSLSSMPTSRSTSGDSSPVDQILSMASAISQFENSSASPQVTAPLRVPRKPPQLPSSLPSLSLYATGEPTDPGRPPPSPELSLRDGQPAAIAEQSYSSYEDPSTRISVTYSDGGAGIGLTMLQTLVDDDDDDDDDNWSQSSRYSTGMSPGPVVTHGNVNETQVLLLNEPNNQNGKHIPHSAETTIPQYSISPSRSPSPSANSLSLEPSGPAYDTEARRGSLAPSVTSSSSWENAIYDDYRYSRYSMVGKVARFSTVSAVGTVASSNEQPPPIPEPRPGINIDSRPSVDSRPSLESRPSESERNAEVEVRPPPRLSSLNFHKFRWPNKPPIPLALQSQSSEEQPAPAVHSPLLNTNWGSPVSSKHESTASSYTTSSFAHTSQLSHQLADESEQPGSRASQISGDGHAEQIIVEDSEELPSHIQSITFHETLSSLPEPTLDKSEGENTDPSAVDDPVPKATDSRLLETDVTLVLPPQPSALAFPAVPPPPPSTPANSSNCPRLSLADLRGELIPGTNQRQSLFLPHPNAPKSPGMLSLGPMYIQSIENRAFARQPGPPRINSVGIIHMALSRPRPPPIAGHPYHGPTIYGRTETALSMSVGPVPISFSLEPLLSMGSPPHQSTTPKHTNLLIDRRPTATLIAEQNEMIRSPVQDQAQPHNERTIPRSNFSPKTPGIRPRSRSFSGFNSATADLPQSEKRDASDFLRASDMKRSLSAKLTTSTPSLSTSSAPALPPPSLTKPIVKSLPLRPSPLSLPQNRAAASQNDLDHIALPKSPVVDSNDFPLSLLSPVTPNLQIIMTKLTVNDSRTGTPPLNQVSSGPMSPIDGTSEKQSVRPSIDTDSVSVNSDSKSFLTSGASAAGRQNSLRAKLSLPNLIKNRCKQDETSSLASGSQTEVDTVQVKDTDFELVTPSITFYSNSDGEDLRRDGSLEPPPGLIPPGSPALSTFSSRSGPDAAPWQSPSQEPSPLRPSPEVEQSIDAHRQRELRWVSVMSTVVPAQSRKTKKVKRLLLEGVPASVRYLVWSHVTNGRARIVAGVYAQLSSRGRVAASDLIEVDVQRCFKDHPQLQGRESPLLTVLQAYLNMVPDIQYSAGLTMIAGQLLLQGPEEEVFWIFISLMDSYLRPYFSNSGIQLEVDATLFSRALEANDPPVAKRMLMDLNIPPETICADWFMSVFVDTLPTDYVNRVWDIFMYEGIPFLIRVGLAVINCCRVQILQSPNDTVLLDVIRHPPTKLLPSNPDAFIALALDQKLKDDDVRKQRIKMEAQVKRQTQAQAPRKSTANAIISLPRT